MADTKFPYKYARPDAPFHFLGTLCKTQWTNFKKWADSRSANFPAIQEFHQVRAQQLRKTAGLLEKYYDSLNDQSLSPSFQKEAWKPGPNGHFVPRVETDHLPMVTMSKIKAHFREQLQRDEEAVFFMNHLRYLIEKEEDAAQYAHEINSDGSDNLKALLARIDGFFGQVEYESVLVDDTQQYGNSGQPYFRVHPFDEATLFELERVNRAMPGAPIKLKEDTE